VAGHWAASAAKHGIAREDALHAIVHAVDHVASFDEPRVPGRNRPDLFIGPTRDRSQMLEVMVEVSPPARVYVFHVMEARRTTLDLVESLRNT
jgi:hypothetical protein